MNNQESDITMEHRKKCLVKNSEDECLLDLNYRKCTDMKSCGWAKKEYLIEDNFNKITLTQRRQQKNQPFWKKNK